MAFSDKFKKMFNADNDYYDDTDDDVDLYEPARPQEDTSYKSRDVYRTDRRPHNIPTASSTQHYPSSKVVDIHTTAKLQVVLKKPEHFDEATSIADELLEKRTVVVNLEATAKEEAGKLLCFLSGVAYANGGKLKKIANNTYIITPYNVDVMGDLLDELENNGMFFI